MLIAEQSEIGRFVNALFRYADPHTVVGLRSFQHAPGTPARIQGWPRIGTSLDDLVRSATTAATEAANADQPMVFAPPVATFNDSRNASEDNLANGVALSVEIDSGDTRGKQRRLETVIGPATVVVASGGEWSDPDTGEVFSKLHLHWRLSEPTRTPHDHRRLKAARRAATLLAGGDGTAVPSVHPLRWPGSWHRKGLPRLAMIAGGEDAAEIHLDDALDRLEEAVEAAGLRAAGVTAPTIPGKPQAALARLTSALAAIPNADRPWDEWIKVGLLMYRATGGADDGLTAWQQWSGRAGKHVAGDCDERWAHFHTSPPTRGGAGTLFYMAKAAGWIEAEPPMPEPPTDDRGEGYWAALERDMAMSAEQWHDMEVRETGQTIPAAPIGRKVLWTVTEPWVEADIPRRPWLARGYLMRGSVSVLAGPGSAGKSSLMLAWAVALAIGSTLGRFRIHETSRVVIYNVEDDENEQKRRISAIAGVLRVPLARIMERLIVVGPETVGTLLAPNPRGNGTLINTPVMDALREIVERHQADALMLDPFVELHVAEENDNTAVRSVIAAFRTWASSRSMALLLAHHTRKGGSTPGDPDSMRGASSIVGAARVAMTVNVMTSEEAEGFGLSEDRRRDYFRLDGAKSNYARIEDAEWFTRQERILANGDGDIPGDGVAVAWPWKPPSVWREMTSDTITAVLDKIAAGPAPGVLYAATLRGANNARWAGQVCISIFGHTEAQAKQVISTWIKEGVLSEVTYHDEAERKDKKGLIVDRSKVKR